MVTSTTFLCEIDKHARTVLARRLVAQHEVGR